MLAAVVATVLLGRWQYDVWQHHRADNAASVTRLAPVPLDDVLGAGRGVPRRRRSAGRWWSRAPGTRAGTVYVSGRERGRADRRTGW